MDSGEEYLRIQQDLDQLANWANGWQTEFNSDKCKVLHFAHLNQGNIYTVTGRVLGNGVKQKGLRVQTSTWLAGSVNTCRQDGAEGIWHDCHESARALSENVGIFSLECGDRPFGPPRPCQPAITRTQVLSYTPGSSAPPAAGNGKLVRICPNTPV